MKNLLLLILLAFAFVSTAQINPSKSNHYVVSCVSALTDSACNLIANNMFRSIGDSLEDFTDGDVPFWQDVNNLTTDINGALAIGQGWNLPTLPSNLSSVNFSSMLVDNLDLETEGIAGRIIPVQNGKKYAFSFFLASSHLTTYRTNGGTYTLKIYLANCQNFDTTSSGNPEIEGEKQLIYCKTFTGTEDSAWRQYLVSFDAENNYDMLVIYPEISSSSSNAGRYVHFVYPELVPIDPKSFYRTYPPPPGPDASPPTGKTYLLACGVINAAFQWEGPNGIVSDQEGAVLEHDNNINETDEYTFSMWVEGATGNNPSQCEDDESPIISETATHLPTEELVDCFVSVTPFSTCNMIPNATFNKLPANSSNINAFNLNVPYWASMNGATPDLNGGPWAPIVTIPPKPAAVPATANAASLFINTSSSSYSWEGIYAKIPQLVSGRQYALSFFLNLSSISNHADFTFNVRLGNCIVFPTSPPDVNTQESPGNFVQSIVCQDFPGVATSTWQQYFVKFTANANHNMIVVYPLGNLDGTGATLVHFLYPELIDVTNLTSASSTTCGYNLQACGVANSTINWFDGNLTNFGTGSPISVNATTNPGLYTATLSVPNILNNPHLANPCGTNTESVSDDAPTHKIWIGTTSDWNTAGNWSPSGVPNSTTTDIYIPSGTPNPPTISSGTYQIRSIVIQSGGSLINRGVLQIAGSVRAEAGSISNFNGIVVGSIEMNGTCGTQLLAGTVFVSSDVKNFTVSNNVTLTGMLDVIGELSFSGQSRTLTTGGNLTLVSTAITTANVAQIHSSNFITGDVTVERHILTGTGTGEHSKKWQALATPTGTNSIGQSVYDSWMEGGNNSSTGYGTNIPDPSWTSTITNGFDGYAFIPSIKTYNPSTHGFDAIANTGIPLYNKNGYFIFVRGDRSKQLITDDPNPTNLRSKGALFQPYTGYAPPSVTVPLTIPGSPTIWKFAMVGNPYASAIDIEYMKDYGYFTNLTNNVTVWDPLLAGSQGLGGYQTLVAANNYEPTPGGTSLYIANTSYPEIQSGQAFFVGTLANSTAGSVTFDEAIKSSNSRVVTRQANINARGYLKANLYYGTNICDGNTIIFENVFKNDIDANDAGKLLNPGENFMITKNNKFFLAVETRQQTKEVDSIFYAFKNLRPITYQLRFASTNLQEEGLHATLIDNYLGKKIPLNLTDSNFVDFTVDSNASSYENRFIVIFGRDAKPPEKNAPLIADKITIASFVIYPNPVDNKTINIRSLNQASGNYKVELINHVGQVVYNTSIKINDKNEINSIKLGSIAAGSYELNITANDGKKSVQQVLIK